MSNILTQENLLLQDPIVITSTMLKPWRASVIDSLATITCTRKVSTIPILVRKIVWEGGTDGDVLTIKNGVGITLITLTGNAEVPQTVDFCPLVCWSDFQVTISSGTLSVFTGGASQDESGEAEDSAFDLLVTEATTRRFRDARCYLCKLKSWISKR